MGLSGGIISMAVLLLSGKILIAEHLWKKHKAKRMKKPFSEITQPAEIKKQETKTTAPDAPAFVVPIRDLETITVPECLTVKKKEKISGKKIIKLGGRTRMINNRRRTPKKRGIR